MGKWAQYSRRGTASRGQSSSAPQLLLAAVPPDGLEWTWTGVNPDHWQAYGSENFEGPYFAQGDPVPGALRAGALYDPGFYYVRGEDAGGAEVVRSANIVLLEA